MKSKDKIFFSLIELLAVIVIALILMGIVVPAFLDITKGQSVDLATREIGSKLKAVRTYAISQRQYTALVFITNQAVTSDRYSYKSYRACTVEPDTDGITWRWKQPWISDEKWDFLPTGVIIRSISTSLSAIAGSFESGVSNTVTSVEDSNVLSSTSSLPAIIFKPTGEIEGSRIYVTVGEGFFSNGSLNTQNTADNAMITLDQFTGRISYGNR